MNRTTLSKAPPPTRTSSSFGGLTLAEAADFGDVFAEAVALARREGRATLASLQAHFGIGTCRAARIVDAMERLGLMPPPVHARARARWRTLAA